MTVCLFDFWLNSDCRAEDSVGRCAQRPDIPQRIVRIPHWEVLRVCTTANASLMRGKGMEEEPMREGRAPPRKVAQGLHPSTRTCS